MLLEAQAGQASAGRGAEGWQRGGFHLRQEQLSWMGVLAGLAWRLISTTPRGRGGINLITLPPNSVPMRSRPAWCAERTQSWAGGQGAGKTSGALNQGWSSPPNSLTTERRWDPPSSRPSQLPLNGRTQGF